MNRQGRARQRGVAVGAGLLILWAWIAAVPQPGPPPRVELLPAADGSAPPRPAVSRFSRERIERAISAGLGWLERAQEADGSWDSLAHNPARDEHGLPGFCGLATRGIDPAVSALAFLAFLEAGALAAGSPHAEAARAALSYLRETAGDYVHHGGPPDSGCTCHAGYGISRVYNPPLVALAVLRGYEVAPDEDLRARAAEILAYLAATRDRTGKACLFLPVQDSGPSVFTLEALLSARRAGVPVPAHLEAEAARYWQRILEPATGRIRHKDVNPQCLGGWDAMAISLAFQRAFGEGQSAVARLQRKILFEHPPAWDAGWKLPAVDPPRRDQLILLEKDIVNFFYWYHATRALRPIGGESWANWRESLLGALLEHQCADGEEAGSWSPDDPWGRIGGRVYSTAFAVMALAAAR